ncbi:hypothetical protein OJAV_G00069020 [Oryzias javanicus]|uniref:Uncharacterized protein n=1 Tax=Oryzias javanicus TaxID=123683 RepID=A0A3S2Q5L1_ORYJA|nr:hypothetical protein OJAV_G00069020 [Oryzias javanicus]
MVSVVTEAHAWLIHSMTCRKVAWRILPVAVKLCSPSVIHCSHRRRNAALKLRFTEMSSGWSTFVKPPGMIAGMELKTLSFALDCGVMCARMLSITSRALRVLKKPSGRFV